MPGVYLLDCHAFEAALPGGFSEKSPPRLRLFHTNCLILLQECSKSFLTRLSMMSISSRSEATHETSLLAVTLALRRQSLRRVPRSAPLTKRSNRH